MTEDNEINLEGFSYTLKTFLYEFLSSEEVLNLQKRFTLQQQDETDILFFIFEEEQLAIVENLQVLYSEELEEENDATIEPEYCLVYTLSSNLSYENAEGLLGYEGSMKFLADKMEEIKNLFTRVLERPVKELFIKLHREDY